MGSIRYLHSSSLIIIDEALLTIPEESFSSLFEHVSQNSSINEALNYEILRVIDANSRLINF